MVWVNGALHQGIAKMGTFVLDSIKFPVIVDQAENLTINNDFSFVILRNYGLALIKGVEDLDSFQFLGLVNLMMVNS